MKEILRKYDKAITVLILSIPFACMSIMCGKGCDPDFNGMANFLEVMAVWAGLAVWIAIGIKIWGKHKHIINESYIVALFAAAFIYSKVAYFPGGKGGLSTEMYITGAVIMIGIIAAESIVHIRRKKAASDKAEEAM